MVKQIASTIALLPLLLILAIFTCTILLILGYNQTKINVAEVEGAKNSNNSLKLFVFGDSYVDTGNFLNSRSYKPPSGISFPGKPAGRYGNGRILTDYVASFLKIETPTPYALRNSSNLQYGMNFAYGGTGIFPTLVDGPNMTLQIDLLEKLIEQNVYTKSDLESSVILVNVGANDYIAFVQKNWRIWEISQFTESLVKEMSVNLRRIHSLGAEKIAVGLLQPVGCLPVFSGISLFHNCIDLFNLVSKNHNKKMLQTVKELNQEMGKSVFMTLDLYNSFLFTITTMKKSRAENSTLMNPLKPCCAALSVGFECGKVDDKGEKKYNLCEKPEHSFFWDNAHPSQNGWYAVYMMLQSSLSQLTKKNF